METNGVHGAGGAGGEALDVGGADPSRAGTGIAGLDEILGGGLPRNHTYLVQGRHGSGKTTLGLQFCLAGANRGERTLFLATCESESEIREVARSHGWKLDGVNVHYHDVRESVGTEPSQSVFHPAELELPQTIGSLLTLFDQVDPQRLVVDSLSEIRLLAGNSRWFRHQILALKDHLANRQCTTLLCDDWPHPDQPVQSIVHGVIDLEQIPSDYGPDHRRLRIAKLRGQRFSSGYHDLRLRTGGLELFPRLVAAEHRRQLEGEVMSSGVPELDAMFGGGVDRGTAILLMGPSGTGKSTVASQFAAAAAGRGEPVAMYAFDERVQTMLGRANGLGIPLREHVDRGLVDLRQIDPSELTAGEFSASVKRAVTERGVRLVVIDSLAGYEHAMPNERALTLYLHELLGYLAEQGVAVLMVMTQHGLAGSPRRVPFDLSYIADSVLLFHMFEYAGELRKALSVYKRRFGNHESTLRELKFDREGIRIGGSLRQFQGIVTGTPHYSGGQLPDVRDDQEG